MRNRNAKNMALGGLLAATAVVVMCLGGLIPLATYVCCVICMFLGQIVLKLCGKRVAWAWYGSVAILGFYPILKPWFEKLKIGLFMKLLYFNAATIFLYWCLIHLFGMNQFTAEFHELGRIGIGILLALGNITFFLTDNMLTLVGKQRKKYGR